MKPKIIIIGAGGHAKVVCETIITEGKYSVVGFTDANLSVGTSVIDNINVILAQSELNKAKDFADYFIVAIGNNSIREKLFNQLKSDLKPATIIHPLAYVSKSAILKNGVVCLANSTINTQVEIGENSIVNCGVVIDHECKIGNHVHLSIGSNIGSNSIVDDFVTTKIGESVFSFSKIAAQ
jgi:sugar O-acyltransferase (sialic acid O-acetyltransferase NeuD family)